MALQHVRSAALDLPVKGPVSTTEEAPFGLRDLQKTYSDWQTTGMIRNIGSKVVSAGAGTLVLEGNLTADDHGFPTSRGPIVHGGALATLADEALATVAYTLAEEGQTTTTADLKIDFYRPGRPGRLIARAKVSHKTRRLAFCHATVEQETGEVVAEARAVIAYVKA